MKLIYALLITLSLLSPIYAGYDIKLGNVTHHSGGGYSIEGSNGITFHYGK